MSASDESAAKPWRWRMECLGHVVIECLAGWLPGRLAFRLGEGLGSVAWFIFPARRKIVRRSLRIAFAGEKSVEEIEKMTRENFRRTGGNLISAANTAKVKPERLGEVLTISNPELLDDALAENKGVIILLSHMGNWELLSRMIHFFPTGTSAGAFYRPLNNPLMDRRLLLRRQNDGTRMFSKGDNALQVATFLRSGGVVGILADQRVGIRGELVRFFGRMTRASPLPSLLARRAKCPVVALGLKTIGPGRWRAEYLRVDGSPTTGACMAALEAVMRSSPEDVFWMHERWKVHVRPRNPMSEWLEDGGSAEGRRHRALLWLAGVPNGWKPAKCWMHADVDYEVVLGSMDEVPSWIPTPVVSHVIDLGRIADRLREIENSHLLPIDYILTCEAPGALVAAAESEQIRVVSLPVAIS